MSQSTTIKTVGGVTTTTKISTMTKTTQQRTTSSAQNIQQQKTVEQKVTAKSGQTTNKEEFNQISAKSNVDSSQTNHQNSKHLQRQNASTTKPQPSHTEDICVRCDRTVYKMEEVIAEQQVWHKNCFRCKECNKPLNRHSKVDSFQIHEGVVYCKFHFKQLFGLKDDSTKVKRELIIRENQPAELPDGVVRSTTGYDLGLDNIQTADVKTRFQMFEKISTKKEAPEELQRNVGMKRSAAVLSKMKKIRAKGIDVGDAYKQQAKLKDSVEDDDDSIHSEDYEDDEDVDLIRAKRAQRERPLIIDNMNEIKTKFEAGIEQSREARHLERKMEIQNIRSKLFWGKQARTKEMYESAVAELEINPKLRNKGLLTAYELDNVKAAANKKQTIQQRFETGDAFKKSINDDDDEVNGDDSRIKQQQELESKALISNKVSERMQMLAKQQAKDQMIKSHLKVKNVEKADILNQFEFFENYNPDEHIRKDFKITPTESSVQQKNSAHDENNETLEKNGIKIDGMKIDGLKIDGVVEKAKNTYLHSLKKNETLKIRPSVLNSRNANQLNDKKVEPTKTIQSESQPHPNEESESEAESEISSRKPSYLDEDLKFARAAARTRDLKERFEQWNYDNNVCDMAEYNDSIPEYDEIDESQTETTKSIRAKFETLPHSGRIQNSKQPKD